MSEYEVRGPFFVVALREETEACERNTDGCCVDHTASPEYDGCETW